MYCYCKDCKNSRQYDDGTGARYCDIGMYGSEDNDYCALSESKTGEYFKTIDECTTEELIAEIIRRTRQ